MRRLVGIFGLVALTGGLLAPAAQACGGFFCRTVPIDQAGEKIVSLRRRCVTPATDYSIAYSGGPVTSACPARCV